MSNSNVKSIQWDGAPSTIMLAQEMFGPAIEGGTYQSLPPQPFMRCRTKGGNIEVLLGHYVVGLSGDEVAVYSPAAFALRYAGEDLPQERVSDAWDAHGTTICDGLE